ncbi:MAG: ribosome-binding factor A [Candidatus Pacebacteria bacterium]|nr:ribosome-binding factor A [Candidatus Paceibacterota bacterium]
MKGDRLEKLNKEMRKAFSEFIERESNRESLVTVTRCDTAPDLSNVIVYISVLPSDAEDKVISFLNRRRVDARTHMKKRVISRRIPQVNFMIDYGEKNRQHIDQLLKES